MLRGEVVSRCRREIVVRGMGTPGAITMICATIFLGILIDALFEG